MPITGTLACVATLGMATHWRDDVDPMEWVTELAKTVGREEPSEDPAGPDHRPVRGIS